MKRAPPPVWTSPSGERGQCRRVIPSGSKSVSAAKAVGEHVEDARFDAGKVAAPDRDSDEVARDRLRGGAHVVQRLGVCPVQVALEERRAIALDEDGRQLRVFAAGEVAIERSERLGLGRSGEDGGPSLGLSAYSGAGTRRAKKPPEA